MRYIVKVLRLVAFVFCGVMVQIVAQDEQRFHDDHHVSVALSMSKSMIVEFESDTIRIELTANRPVPDPLLVRLKLGGTATRDLDYEIGSTNVVLNRGEDEVVVRLEPLRDWI